MAARFLVGGHKRSAESFQQCLVREIREELGLVDGQDCFVAAEPAAHMAYVGWSEGAGQETWYVIELFPVALTNEAANQKVDANQENRWLSEEEIHRRTCEDGKPVSETIERLLSHVKGLDR